MNSMSWLQLVLGAAKCTTWPSSNSSMGDQGSITGDQRKSVRNITSLFSTPSHSYEQVAGDRKLSYTTLRGSKMKVLPQLGGGQ